MLRAYQQEMKEAVKAEWAAGVNNIIGVLPTGAGKTVTMAHLAKDFEHVAGVAIAHRSVLIGQISMALARVGIRHDIVAQKSVIRTIVEEHMEELGRSWYSPSSDWKVASVDTLPGRAERLASWINRVRVGITDEGHHVTAENRWGRECMRFRNARWFLPTATPKRGDRKGLGRHADGIADKIIEGPSMQWHIDNGYLTNFLIRAPMPADLDLSDVEVSSGGEYNQKQLRKAVHRSNKIIGNVVETYQKFTSGKLGIVFGVDIEHAKKLCEGFVAAGVPAEIITAEHTEEQRREILKRYRERKTLVLVNVDLFGEGFDLPAIEVVMFARPTASYSLYAQQFGRGLRLMIDKQYQQHWESYTPEQRRAIIAASGKPVAHIHDHVGNIVHFYGPPTKPQKWTLDRESARKTGPSDAIPLRVCLNDGCLQPYERSYPACPYCGMEPKPAAPPKLPIEVDGDLTLYTPEMLSRLFGVSSVDEALAIRPYDFLPIPPGASLATQRALQANHRRKHLEQQKLAGLMSLVMPPLHDDRVNQRRFFLRYGIDVVAARMLGAADTERLNEKLLDTLMKTSND